jgi:hypothetical protein
VYISDLNKLINSNTNFRAFKENWIVIWLKQSNFTSNAGSLLEPDEGEFETTGMYYISCPVALIYIALQHFIWNYSRQAKYNSTTVHTRFEQWHDADDIIFINIKKRKFCQCTQHCW